MSDNNVTKEAEALRLFLWKPPAVVFALNNYRGSYIAKEIEDYINLRENSEEVVKKLYTEIKGIFIDGAEILKRMGYRVREAEINFDKNMFTIWIKYSNIMTEIPLYIHYDLGTIGDIILNINPGVFMIRFIKETEKDIIFQKSNTNEIKYFGEEITSLIDLSYKFLNNIHDQISKKIENIDSNENEAAYNILQKIFSGLLEKEDFKIGIETSWLMLNAKTHRPNIHHILSTLNCNNEIIKKTITVSKETPDNLINTQHHIPILDTYRLDLRLSTLMCAQNACWNVVIFLEGPVNRHNRVLNLNIIFAPPPLKEVKELQSKLPQLEEKAIKPFQNNGDPLSLLKDLKYKREIISLVTYIYKSFL